MREFSTIDDSRFPIVVIKFQEFIPTLEEFVASQLRFEKFAAQNENFVLVVDLTKIAFLPSQYRIAQAKWHVKNEETFLRQKMRIAFYTPSIVSQLVMKGFLLTARPKVPYSIARTLESAEAWATKQLGAPYPK